MLNDGRDERTDSLSLVRLTSMSSHTSITSPPKPVVQRIDCVLLHRRIASSSSIMSPAPSEDPASSRPLVQPRTTKSYASSRGATPLGRGHRLKKPNIRLSSALSELDEPENPPEPPRPAPKRARRAPSSDNAGEDKRVRIWCHQCHQDRTTAATIECTSCTKSYCYSCLSRR